MYKNITVNKLLKLKQKIINKKISISGWVKTKRKLNNNLIFIDLNDGSCLNCIQIIVKKNLDNYSEILNIITGYSINVIGYIVKSIGSEQLFDLIAEKIKIFGIVKNTGKYPLSSKKHSFEYLRNILHLRPRTYFFSSVARIRNSLFYKIHKFMNFNKFIWIPTPIITSSDTEGESKLFNIFSENDNIENNKNNFFKKKVFLTVSGQLNAEVFACSMNKVYSFGPVFRAENSNTRKHLSEFWMIEPEIAFYNLSDIIKFSEILIKKIFKFIIINNTKDIEYINSKIKINTITLLENWINKNFIKLEYLEIIKILNKSNKFNIKWGDDLNSDHENFLLKIFNLPIFIINFPKNIKPFYMKLNNDNKTVASMDLIFPNIGEIIGGSEREDKFEVLKNRMKINNIINDWYLDLRKFGTIPHSGFGIGFERLILLITGIKNIRDVSAFPRSPGNINC